MEPQTRPLGYTIVKLFVRIIVVSLLGFVAFRLYPQGIFSISLAGITPEHVIKLIFSACCAVMVVIFLFKRF